MIFDIIIIALLAFAAYKGYSKGFIIQAATFAGLILGLILANRFSYILYTWLETQIKTDPKVISLLAFIMAFIGVVILVQLAARLLNKLVDAIALGPINRIAGIFFGLVKMAFILSFVFFVLNTVNTYVQFLPQNQVKESRLYNPISSIIPLVIPKVYPFDKDGEMPLQQKEQFI